MTNITIANKLLTIGLAGYNADDCVARIKNSTTVIIINRNEPKDGLFEGIVSALKINNTGYATAALFCKAFNELAGGKTADDILHTREEATDIRANTDYPDTIISSKLTIGAVKAQAANLQKPGYIEIETDDDNSGVIYVGGAAVDANSCNMKAGKRRSFEVDDLSKIWLLGSDAGQVVNVSGAYKN